MFSKRNPWRSEKYLAFVREQNCTNCGKPAHIDGMDAHHATGVGLGKGMGTKISDSMTLPLCRGCHQKVHADKDIIDQQRAALLMIEKALQDGVLVAAK
jgi:hypothetical protein